MLNTTLDKNTGFNAGAAMGGNNTHNSQHFASVNSAFSVAMPSQGFGVSVYNKAQNNNRNTEFMRNRPTTAGSREKTMGALYDGLLTGCEETTNKLYEKTIVGDFLEVQSNLVRGVLGQILPAGVSDLGFLDEFFSEIVRKNTTTNATNATLPLNVGTGILPGKKNKSTYAARLVASLRPTTNNLLNPGKPVRKSKFSKSPDTNTSSPGEAAGGLRGGTVSEDLALKWRNHALTEIKLNRIFTQFCPGLDFNKIPSINSNEGFLVELLKVMGTSHDEATKSLTKSKHVPAQTRCGKRQRLT